MIRKTDLLTKLFQDNPTRWFTIPELQTFMKTFCIKTTWTLVIRSEQRGLRLERKRTHKGRGKHTLYRLKG